MTDDLAEAFNKILSAIQEAADGAYVTKWIVVAETITDDGEPQIEQFYPANTNLWDHLGLLMHALEERKQLVGSRDDG